jgi:hypothetical protein
LSQEKKKKKRPARRRWLTPIILGGRDQENHGSKPAGQIVRKILSQKKNKRKKKSEKEGKKRMEYIPELQSQHMDSYGSGAVWTVLPAPGPVLETGSLHCLPGWCPRVIP